MEQAKLNVSGITEDSITDGPGLRFVLFVQGCPHHCRGCHNPSTHIFGVGLDMSVDEIYQRIKNNPLQTGITFSGGEPFCQAKLLADLAERLKKRNYHIAVYTGYTFEELINSGDCDKLRLLSNIDILIDGKFELEKRNLEILFRGSENQRILDVPQSLSHGVPIWTKDMNWLGC